MLNGRLSIWTLYHRPVDHPGREYVVALDFTDSVTMDAHALVTSPRQLWFAEDLEAARAIVREKDPTADFRLEPGPDDPPQIVEQWL